MDTCARLRAFSSTPTDFSLPTPRPSATRPSMVPPSIGINGSTSVAPTRGCAPVCFVRSINSMALPVHSNAASATASGSPARVTTERLWSASISRSSTYTPGTLLIAATMASTLAASRPSEQLGTHSISRFLFSVLYPACPHHYLRASACGPVMSAVHTRTPSSPDYLTPPASLVLGQPGPEVALALSTLALAQGASAAAVSPPPVQFSEATAARLSAS